jgi:hypothetical protein
VISSERLCQIGFAVRRRFIRLRITCWGVCRPTATYVVPDDIQRTVWGGRSVAVSFNVLFRSRLVEHINALNVPLRARAQCGSAAQCDNARTPLVLGQQSQRSHARPPFSQSISDSRGPAATAPHAQSFPALPPCLLALLLLVARALNLASYPAARSRPYSERPASPKETPLFLSFPYVCPEPVLVK